MHSNGLQVTLIDNTLFNFINTIHHSSCRSISVYILAMAPQGRRYILSSSSSNTIQCQYCTQTFSTRGIKAHESSCLRKRQKKRDDQEFALLVAQASGKAKKQGMFGI
jgi:hypothetical protein